MLMALFDGREVIPALSHRLNSEGTGIVRGFQERSLHDRQPKAGHVPSAFLFSALNPGSYYPDFSHRMHGTLSQSKGGVLLNKRGEGGSFRIGLRLAPAVLAAGGTLLGTRAFSSPRVDNDARLKIVERRGRLTYPANQKPAWFSSRCEAARRAGLLPLPRRRRCGS